ncbi:MAG TPA: hypothetical protein V6D08_06270 [Candidatus Obscuribacterales bacterium]
MPIRQIVESARLDLCRSYANRTSSIVAQCVVDGCYMLLLALACSSFILALSNRRSVLWAASIGLTLSGLVQLAGIDDTLGRDLGTWTPDLILSYALSAEHAYWLLLLGIPLSGYCVTAAAAIRILYVVLRWCGVSAFEEKPTRLPIRWLRGEGIGLAIGIGGSIAGTAIVKLLC